jgi:uncharacterized Fe-S cluster protein YjdI
MSASSTAKVTWDANVCVHAGNCVKGLPVVFKVGSDGLEIHQHAASEDEIRAVVASCPSGALQYDN